MDEPGKREQATDFGETAGKASSSEGPPAKKHKSEDDSSSRLRLRGVRATRGASAERGNYLCSTPSSQGVSSRDGVEGVFCVSEGARQSGACGVNGGSRALAPGAHIMISIWLANGAKVGTL